MLNATAYKYDLNANRTLYVGSHGTTTTITLQSGHVGQQQQSSNQFSTGQWTAMPRLYSLGEGVVVVITTLTETYYLQVQGTQMQMGSGPISAELAAHIDQSPPLPLQTVESMPAATFSAMSSYCPSMSSTASMSFMPSHGTSMPHANENGEHGIYEHGQRVISSSID